MKIKIQTLIVLTLLMSSIACENAKNQDSTTKTEPEAVENHTKNELSLNDGKPWLANQETTEGINNMIQFMDSFSEKDSVEAYNTLADSLESEFTMIFKKCTMKGESHNQLHNYLLPMKAEFKKLSSTNLSESKSAFANLNKHLTVYKEYFN